MDQVTKVRKYLKREQWKSLIKECQSSGMTVTAWCALNGICKQTYYRNLKKLRACTAEYMLGDITVAENIYIACGYTDMRKSIPSLQIVA